MTFELIRRSATALQAPGSWSRTVLSRWRGSVLIAKTGKAVRQVDGARENGEALIEARGQVVGFGYRKIVSNIYVAVRAGEMVALIVPNGAGKSTVVRVML